MNGQPSHYDPFPNSKHTNEQKLVIVREWFERHKNDYCRHDQAPPFAWSGYFQWLLTRAESLSTQSRTAGERK